MWCRPLVSIIPFIIRIPCTILVIAVLRRQGWNRAFKDNDVLLCEPNNICSCTYRIQYRISYTILYVWRTISYVKIQVLAILTYDFIYDVVYYVVRFLYDIVCTTFDITKKRTISYVSYRFLPFWRTTSHTISYVFGRCRIRCVMQHRYYTISYVRFRCRCFTSPKTYDIVLRRRMQYCSIRYAICSIRYACLGRRQAWRDVLDMPLQLPRVLLPDHRPCRMVCIAQAQCRTPFPHWQSGILCCCQCEWRPPCTSKNRNCSESLDQNSSWFVCI